MKLFKHDREKPQGSAFDPCETTKSSSTPPQRETLQRLKNILPLSQAQGWSEPFGVGRVVPMAGL